MKEMVIAATLVYLLFAPFIAWPQKTPGYTFHQVKWPDANEVFVRGINDRAAARGDLVGTYRDFNDSHIRFVKFGSAFLKFNPDPEDPCHWPNAINNARVIVGEYCTINEDHTFQVQAGFENIGSSKEHTEQAHVALIAPNAIATVANGNNDAGDIVGIYAVEGTFHSRGFLLQGDTYTDLPPIEWWEVHPIDINNRGVIVGTLYQEETGDTHGFRYENGQYQFFEIPEGAYGWVEGINDHGHIVGSYWDFEYETGDIFGNACCWRGFLMKDGRTTVLNVTNDASTTTAGINNVGHIAGTFWRPNTWLGQGFIAVPKAVKR